MSPRPNNKQISEKDLSQEVSGDGRYLVLVEVLKILECQAKKCGFLSSRPEVSKLSQFMMPLVRVLVMFLTPKEVSMVLF